MNNKIIWIITQYFFIYIYIQIIPGLIFEGSFIWFLCPFDIAPAKCVWREVFSLLLLLTLQGVQVHIIFFLPPF